MGLIQIKVTIEIMDNLSEEAFSDTKWLHCVEDLINRDEVLKMKNFKHHMNTTCFEHCVHVSYLSYKFLEKRGVDGRSVARVGLLHDLFLYQREDLKPRIKRVTHIFTHGKIALAHAESITVLSKKEQRAIKRHMFPLTLIPSVSKEGIAICFYDKVCCFKEITNKFRRKGNGKRI